jgi:hypothetical protein
MFTSTAGAAEIDRLCLFFDFYGLPAALQRALAAAGDNKFRPALFANIALSHFVCHALCPSLSCIQLR